MAIRIAPAAGNDGEERIKLCQKRLAGGAFGAVMSHLQNVTGQRAGQTISRQQTGLASGFQIAGH